MPALYKDGKNYSHNGPRVDVELTKGSPNAAPSGQVYDKIEEIQSQIVPTASIESGATASKAYNVGDFLVKDGVLYKVTNAIVKEDVLTVGANIELDTVASELSEISERLSQMSQSEYTFQYTTAGKWGHFTIDESNAFLDGSSYFVRSLGTGVVENMPVNGFGNQCAIVIDNNNNADVQFNSSYTGHLHLFIRYK